MAAFLRSNELEQKITADADLVVFHPVRNERRYSS